MDKDVKELLRTGTMQELLNLSQALAIAVDKGFMKREHAGAVWKRILTLNRIDTTKKEVNEEDAIT